MRAAALPTPQPSLVVVPSRRAECQGRWRPTTRRAPPQEMTLACRSLRMIWPLAPTQRPPTPRRDPRHQPIVASQRAGHVAAAFAMTVCRDILQQRGRSCQQRGWCNAAKACSNIHTGGRRRFRRHDTWAERSGGYHQGGRAVVLVGAVETGRSYETKNCIEHAAPGFGEEQYMLTEDDDALACGV